jgi:hypothetical protein
MSYTIPRVLAMLEKNSGDVVFNPDFFEDRASAAIGAVVRTPRPILKFENDQVHLGYNVGTRGNGKDRPYWPDDLMTEVVS